MLTNVQFSFHWPDGRPMAETVFEIRHPRAGFLEPIDGIIMPELLEYTTDEGGELIVPLAPSSSPYYVKVSDPDSFNACSGKVVYTFYVPQSDPADTVRVQDLIIAPPPSTTAYDEAALLVIIDAKAASIEARDRAEAAAAKAEEDANGIGDAVERTQAHAEAARLSEVASKASELASKTSELAAGVSQAAALLSEQHALASEQAAAAFEGVASSAAASADQDAAAASLSEQNAKASELASKASEAATHDDAEAAKLARDTAVAAKDVASANADTATAAAATATDRAAAANLSAVAAKTSEDLARLSATATATDAANTAADRNVVEPLAAQVHVDAVQVAADKVAVAADTLEAKQARDEAVEAAQTSVGALIERGDIDLSSGLYPAKPITASIWKVTVGGTVAGVVYTVGDSLVYSKTGDYFYKVDNTESVSSVNSKTGAVVLGKADIGLSLVDNTPDASKPLSTAAQNALATKEPTIPTGTNAQYINGLKQAIDFDTTARAVRLTGLTLNNLPLLATDTLLVGMGKLQAQMDNRPKKGDQGIGGAAIPVPDGDCNKALVAGNYRTIPATLNGRGVYAILEVFDYGDDDTSKIQRLTATYGNTVGDAIWFRTGTDKGARWSEWRLIVSVGDYGVGSVKLNFCADANAVTESGSLAVGPETANCVGTYGTLRTECYEKSSNNFTQLLQSLNGQGEWFRSSINGAITPWRLIGINRSETPSGTMPRAPAGTNVNALPDYCHRVWIDGTSSGGPSSADYLVEHTFIQPGYAWQTAQALNPENKGIWTRVQNAGNWSPWSGPPTLPAKWISGWQTMVANTNYTFTHNLGTAVSSIQWEVRLKAAAAGYTAGTIIAVDAVPNASAALGLTVYNSTNTQFIAKTGSSGNIATVNDMTNGNSTYIALSNCDVRCTAVAVF